MKVSELRQKDFKELNKLIAQERNELRELRFKVASQQIKNFNQIKEKKGNIAKIKTVMNERRNDEKVK